MFSQWDVVSIAFLGGILFLRRFWGRTEEPDKLQWPVPMSPHGSKGLPETVPFVENSQEETQSPQEVQPLLETHQSEDVREASGFEVSTADKADALAWINVEVAGVTFSAEGDSKSDFVKFKADEPEKVQSVDFIEQPALSPALSLEEQITLLEQQVIAGDEELKALGVVLEKASPKGEPARYGPRKTRKVKSRRKKVVELIPLVSWVKPDDPRPERSVPVAGIPGDFTPDQVLGFVKRLWENRSSSRAEVRQQVEEFLPRIVPSLIKVAESAIVPESFRYDAVLMLGNLRANEAVDLLTRLSADPLPAIRYAAATALSAFSPDQAVTPLLRALRDNHYLVRSSAAQSLGKLCPMPALPALVKSLADSSPMVRQSAKEAVQRYSTEELCSRLPFILPRSPTAAISRALKVLASIGDNQKIETFRELLKSEHPHVFSRVVKAGLKMGDPRLADELADAERRLEPMAFPFTITPVMELAKSRLEQPSVRNLNSASNVQVSSRVAYNWVSESIDAEPNQNLRTAPVLGLNPVPLGLPIELLPSFPAGEETAGQIQTVPVSAPERMVFATPPVADLDEFRQKFRLNTGFDQARLLRNLLESNSDLKLEYLSSLYEVAASPFIKAGILDSLKKFGFSAEPFFVFCLREKEEEAVLAVIKALAEVGGDLAAESLSGCRSHPNQHVRFCTEIALEKIRSRKGKA